MGMDGFMSLLDQLDDHDEEQEPKSRKHKTHTQATYGLVDRNNYPVFVEEGVNQSKR